MSKSADESAAAEATCEYGSDMSSDNSSSESSSGNTPLSGKQERSVNSDEGISKPPALPKHKRTPSHTDGNDATQPLKALPELSSPPTATDKHKHKFADADNRRKEDDKIVLAAHAQLVKARSDLKRAQIEMEKAQKAYDKAKALPEEHSELDADNLLLEPTEWSSSYLQLKTFFDREGHSHLKRNITDADIESMTHQEASSIRALSRWACRQRKLKRSEKLEHYKVLLLDRLNFPWDPKTGHGPEKWLKNYSLLKEFKEENGHVEVPMQHGEDKLGLWVKTQLTLYRNGREGKLPALSAERIRMLEEMGICWGERRKGVPWEERFQALLDYKERYGHPHVPWQWKENVGLAQWVNTQRKKFKDLKDGKKSNLSEKQIDLLNSIGFKWSTGGKGRYLVDSPTDKEPASKRARTSNEAPTVHTRTITELASSANGSPPVTTSSAISSGAEATASTASMTAMNPQQALAQASPNHNGLVHTSLPLNTQALNYFGSLCSNGIWANQQHMNTLAGRPQQVLNSATQQALAFVSTQSLQQRLLNQQLIQPPPAPSAQPAYTLQQLLDNPQLLVQPTSSYSTARAPIPPPPQHSSPALVQAYQQLLNSLQPNQNAPNNSPSQTSALADILDQIMNKKK